MKRGDLITIAVAGDYGEPRPALVIQSDFLAATDSVLVCLLTTTLRDTPLYRLSLQATAATGLHKPSQVMVDKIMAARRDRCGTAIGRADDATMAALGPLLGFAIGLVD